jgi:hypothetical protein
VISRIDGFAAQHGMTIGIGLLGLGTVGAGVAGILATPEGRHPLVAELALKRVAVRDLARPRPLDLDPALLTTDAEAVVDDPAVDLVVEVMGGLEPARSLILRSIAAGKPVVTANKAVIARYGDEIAAAAAAQGVYVLIEAAVGGGIPIIEPLKQSLGSNRIQRVSGIINGTTNYILSRMAAEGAAYGDVLADAQRLGYAEADPAADVEGGDAADKIAILAGLAYGGAIERAQIPTEAGGPRCRLRRSAGLRGQAAGRGPARGHERRRHRRARCERQPDPGAPRPPPGRGAWGQQRHPGGGRSGWTGDVLRTGGRCGTDRVGGGGRHPQHRRHPRRHRRQQRRRPSAAGSAAGGQSLAPLPPGRGRRHDDAQLRAPADQR